MEKVICVLILSGPLKGHKFFVKSDAPILIGRNKEANIQITYNGFCSRRHALIYWKNNICVIEDLNSTNGVFVNDIRIYGIKELHNKDIIGLGTTKMIVLFDGHQENKKKDEINNTLAERFKVGDLIGKRYEVHNILEGGMGVVYVCYDHYNAIPCVLKTIKEKYVLTEEDESIFKREAFIWLALDKHPHIVQVYNTENIETNTALGTFRSFLVLEYIAPDTRGRNTLSHYFGNLAFCDILKLSIQFCYGMEYAYSRGIDAHRDIKPDNIMITANMVVKITDFGLAKVFQKTKLKEENISKHESSHLCIFSSGSGVVCGTPLYMAPEQFDGHADKRSDIYSFGIVLYQMVTGGKPPFICKTGIDYEKMHKYDNPPQINSPLFYIIKRCLEKDPNKRYGDFTILNDELKTLLLKETGEKITLPQVTTLNVWELINKGLSLGQIGRFDEAIKCYDKALEIYPKSVDTWVSKGVTLHNFGKQNAAIACFDKALEINPRATEALYRKGISLYILKRHDEAITCFEKALEISPSRTDILEHKGALLGDIGKLDQAIACYNEALEMDPKNIEVLQDKGYLLEKYNRLDEAVYCYDKALEIDPKNMYIWHTKAWLLYKLGNYAEALKCLERMIELNPGDSVGYGLKKCFLKKLNK